MLSSRMSLVVKLAWYFGLATRYRVGRGGFRWLLIALSRPPGAPPDMFMVTANGAQRKFERASSTMY
jgi:hypothetical protein